MSCERARLAEERIKAWNAAIDAAARIADREWVESNSLLASKVSRKIADGIRDLRNEHPATKET
jgi:hypothetical protein